MLKLRREKGLMGHREWSSMTSQCNRTALSSNPVHVSPASLRPRVSAHMRAISNSLMKHVCLLLPNKHASASAGFLGDTHAAHISIRPQPLREKSCDLRMILGSVFQSYTWGKAPFILPPLTENIT